jgi:hypothetical protein
VSDNRTEVRVRDGRRELLRGNAAEETAPQILGLLGARRPGVAATLIVDVPDPPAQPERLARPREASGGEKEPAAKRGGCRDGRTERYYSGD